jgi:hypothetical protein
MITVCSTNNSSSTNENTLFESSTNENETETSLSTAKELLSSQMIARTQKIIGLQMEYIQEIEEYMLEPSSYKNEKIHELSNNQQEDFRYAKTLNRENVESFMQFLDEKQRISKMYGSLPIEEINKISEKNIDDFFETTKQTIEIQEEHLKNMTKNQEEFRKLTNKTNL